MKVLVVGSGGREHALCWAIAKSPKCDELYCAPGNAGTASVARNVDVDSEDLDGIIAFVQDNAIDFVVVGPEAPLVAGLVDRLDALGIKSFGPTAAGAELEGSKAFTKDLCAKYDIPTADYDRFDEPDAAKEYIRTHGAPIVVKADGLAAGKGVIICRNVNEAYAAVDQIMIEEAFGHAGAEIVVEQFLEGEEASFFALVDGETALPMIGAQDHKRAYDGDEGPNTGGMGAYSPAPIIDAAMTERVMTEIIEPTIKGMAAEGRPHKGVDVLRCRRWLLLRRRRRHQGQHTPPRPPRRPRAQTRRGVAPPTPAMPGQSRPPRRRSREPAGHPPGRGGWGGGVWGGQTGGVWAGRGGGEQVIPRREHREAGALASVSSQRRLLGCPRGFLAPLVSPAHLG